MVKKIKKSAILLLLALLIIIFYSPFLLFFKLPIPSDTIIGLYHPYRDYYAKTYPNGIPFKNFLITDPIRQTYIWKELAVDMWRDGKVPIWNPYEMAGKPLLANFQTSAFYPFNVIFFLRPFYLSWSIFIVLQTLMAGIFMYAYLFNLKLKKQAALVGATVFCFCSFSVSWLTWGNILHTALWLPLVLFSIDRICSARSKKWYLLLIASLAMSFLAGHLQTFFYLFILGFAYFFYRWFLFKKSRKILAGYAISLSVFFCVIIFQLIPTVQFLLLSSRSIDQNFRIVEGWFIPWVNLTQIIAPDFFGNPTTLNYWGTWNYGELTIYVGMLPLILAIFTIHKKTKDTIFYWFVFLVSLLFSLPTGLSSLPFLFNVPFISTAQPTRLIFLITFSLAVLAAFGFDFLFERKKQVLKFFIPLIIVGLAIVALWGVVFLKLPFIFQKTDDIITAKRNLLFPTTLFVFSCIYIGMFYFLKNKKWDVLLFIAGFLLIAIDLFRFGQKFTPFTSSSYLYPDTAIIRFLKEQKTIFRVAGTDRRIMPPNFYSHYKLQTIEGYDPLYLKNYAEFISILERNRPDISTPFGFNRIITPQNYNSPLFDLLNVKYVLSFDDIKSDKLTKIMEEGSIKLYLNTKSQNRVFFVREVLSVDDDASALFGHDLANTAILFDNATQSQQNLSVGSVVINKYSENEILLTTENSGNGFLVLTDVYYPTWHAFIDGKETRIIPTDHTFRGLFVPAGKHIIMFKDSLF